MSSSGMPLTLANGKFQRIAEGIDSLNVQNVIPSITNADLEVASNGTGELRFATDSQRALTITSAQRVGIGISSTLLAKLSIETGATENIIGLKVEQKDTTNNPHALQVVNAGTGSALEIGGAGSRLINSTAANLTISTTTSGDLALTSAAVLSLSGHGSATPFNDLSDLSLVGFTSGSVIGALNELKASGSITENVRWKGTVDSGSVSQYELVGADATSAVGHVRLSDANGTTKNCVGVSVSSGSISAGSDVTIASVGRTSVKTSDSGAWTMSEPIYMAQVAGEVTNDISSLVSGDIVQQIGFAIDTTTGTTRQIVLSIGPVVQL